MSSSIEGCDGIASSVGCEGVTSVGCEGVTSVGCDGVFAELIEGVVKNSDINAKLPNNF